MYESSLGGFINRAQNSITNTCAYESHRLYTEHYHEYARNNLFPTFPDIVELDDHIFLSGISDDLMGAWLILGALIVETGISIERLKEILDLTNETENATIEDIEEYPEEQETQEHAEIHSEQEPVTTGKKKGKN